MKFGDASLLHVITFDEIDACMKAPWVGVESVYCGSLRCRV